MESIIDSASRPQIILGMELVKIEVDQLIPSHDRAKARFLASHLCIADRADYSLQGLLR
jgi:hypothetical protein